MEHKTTKNMKEKVNDFFQISEDVTTASIIMNEKLVNSSKHTLIDAFHQFGLEPIYMYLTMKHMNKEKMNWNITGFIRYLDMYLIEMSGGKRTELIQLGEKLTGKQPTSFSIRLLRIEIISMFLQKILQQSN